jgi:8-oxo-dGTP pyrophosphatase MutT (NUDIX family)
MISNASAIAHLLASMTDLTPVPAPDENLRGSLLTAEQAAQMDAHGRTAAAVLLPLYGWPARPGLIFTERRPDLRRHAGEISFPGGRQDDPSEDLRQTALRETEEEIGLDPSLVELVGALPPTGTFVTSYKVHPFVGLIPEEPALEPNPAEVGAILRFDLDELREGYGMKRLIRRGVPIRTPTFTVGRHMIWGATARILGDFFERVPARGT